MTRSGSVPPDPHSFAEPGRARVRHLSLRLRVSFEARVLHGVATLHVERAPDEATLVLDTRGLVIHEVTDEGGVHLPFTLGPEEVLRGAPLRIELRAGTRSVCVRYTTGPEAPALQWIEPAQTAGGQHPFLFTQGHAIETRSFIPLQDSPSVRLTYDAHVEVPAPLVVAMSAERLGVRDDGPTRTFSFRMEEPIPAYLIALVAGALELAPIGPRTGVFAEAVTLERAAHEFAELESMLEAAEALLGPYRWGRFDVVVMPPFFPYGGMENPRLTYASPTLLAGDRSLTTVVVHELAHAWAGNLVTNATWDELWLNEGFTVYLELRLQEVLWGEDRAGMMRVYGWRELGAAIQRMGADHPDTRLQYELAGRDPAVGVTVIPYLKGAALVWTLERAVGRPRMDAWLRGWFDRHAFQPVTHRALLRDLDAHLFHGEASPVDLQRWLHAPGAPPAEAAPDPSAALDRVDALARELLAGAPPSTLPFDGFSPMHWRQLLATLLAAPATPEGWKERLTELDEARSLSRSENCEILAPWLRLAARARLDAALPALRRFLSSQGRGKYLRPLYEELLASEWGAPVAREVYAEARGRYHPLARGMLDRLFA